VFPDCHNKTYIETYCGANDCLEDFNSARLKYNTSECPVSALQLVGPTETLIYVLMGIYAGIGLLGAAVIAFLVDPIVIRYVQHEHDICS